MKRILLSAAAVLLFAAACTSTEVTGVVDGVDFSDGLQGVRIGRYDSGLGEGASEIVAWAADRNELYVVNAENVSVDVLDISNPADPFMVRQIDVSDLGAGANSVAYKNGLVAVAVEAEAIEANGLIAFYNVDGVLEGTVEAGVLPDMVTFSPNGRYVLVANEGEPSDDYQTDPEGSITIIDISNGVSSATARTAGFAAFNPRIDQLRAAGVRIFGPGASVAQDLEPEYITVTDDSSTAFVSLQENNAIARVDIASATVTSIFPLGTKTYNVTGNEIDASNRDGGINIRTWPVEGMYQPDAIASFQLDGVTYLVTANEGDARDYDGFSEEARGADLTLEESRFADIETLLLDENLGRLVTTTASGDRDGDGEFDTFFSFGARSFSIFAVQNSRLSLVGDSGSQIARIQSELQPDGFNANDGLLEEVDARSDDKGAEPEAVVVGKIGSSRYAFVGLERSLGGVMVFNIDDPSAPIFETWLLSNDGTGAPDADVAPEGLVFIPAEESPTGSPLVVASYEVSGSVAIFALQ